MSQTQLQKYLVMAVLALVLAALGAHNERAADPSTVQRLRAADRASRAACVSLVGVERDLCFDGARARRSADGPHDESGQRAALP